MSKLGALEDELKLVKKAQAEQRDAVMELAKNVDSISSVEQRLSFLVLKELDKVLPSRVVGTVTNGVVEVHPVFLQLMQNQFMSKGELPPKGLSEQELKALVQETLAKQPKAVGLKKEEVLQLVQKELAALFDKASAQKSEHLAVEVKSMQREVDELKRLASSTKQLSEERVNRTVQGLVSEVISGALERYAADRIGLPDFALASTGTKIYFPLTSATYRSPKGFLANLLNLGVAGKPPVTAIQVSLLAMHA